MDRHRRSLAQMAKFCLEGDGSSIHIITSVFTEQPVPSRTALVVVIILR
jgi:hypothetical protein